MALLRVVFIWYFTWLRHVYFSRYEGSVLSFFLKLRKGRVILTLFKKWEKWKNYFCANAQIIITYRALHGRGVTPVSCAVLGYMEQKGKIKELIFLLEGSGDFGGAKCVL